MVPALVFSATGMVFLVAGGVSGTWKGVFGSRYREKCFGFPPATTQSAATKGVCGCRKGNIEKGCLRFRRQEKYREQR